MTASSIISTTTEGHLRPACPIWCTGHHSVEDVDIDGSRYHPGPTFGSISFSGVTGPDGSVRSFAADSENWDRPDGMEAPAELRKLAADALAAAEWLEAHR